MTGCKELEMANIKARTTFVLLFARETIRKVFFKSVSVCQRLCRRSMAKGVRESEREEGRERVRARD